MKGLEAATDLLQQMVGIESLSGAEAALADFLVRTMSTLGFDAHVDEVGNAVGVRKGSDTSDTARELVLLGHMDTVPGDIPLRVEDNILHGRGSVDAKGSLAAFILAVSEVKPSPGTRVVVVGAVEEECSTSRGARHRAELHRPEACIIGEPSGHNALTLGYKGRLGVQCRYEKACGHGAGPEGTSSEQVCNFWSQVRNHADIFNVGRQRLFDRLLPALISIGSDSDGLYEQAWAALDIRLPLGLDQQQLKARMEEMAHPGSVKFSGGEEAYRSPRTSPLANAFARAFRSRGWKPRFKHKTGTSDMNILGPAWGCPMVAYGPGDSTLDHTPNEHLDLMELKSAIDILQEAMGNLGFA